MANFGEILSSLSIGAGQSVRRNAGNTAFEAYTPSTGGGITIGDAVSGGTANRVLYIDGSGNLANDADFTFDGTDLTLGSSLKLPTTTGTAGIVFQNGSRYIHSKGTDNLFLGRDAGNLTNTASYNVGIGTQALNGITTGQANMAVGYNALYSLTTQTGNFAVGYSAGQNCTGAYNSLLGYQAGYNASGTGNISIGASTMSGASSSSNYNVALGMNALYSISGSSSHGNVALGFYALNALTTGAYNVAVGYEAGLSLTTNGYGVFLGYQAGRSETAANRLYIENSSSSTPLIYGEFDNDLLRVHGILYVRKTTEQIRAEYDGSNYFSTTVGSTGGVTFDAVGSGAGFTFSDAISFPLGGAISGGGANRVLYEDGSQNLATDADFYFTSDELYIGSARVGEWSGGGGYAVFGHKTAITSSANNYAVLQSSGGATYFNTAAGGELHFRIGNSDKFIIYDGYTAFNATADPAVAFWLEPAASNNFGLLIRGKASQSNPLFEVRNSSNATKFQIDGSYNVTINGSLTLSAQNIVTDTTTGMKIGTGTTQRLGFFNATPVVQRTDSGALTDSTGGSVTGTIGEVSATYDEAEHNANYASLTAKINALRTALRDLGLMA